VRADDDVLSHDFLQPLFVEEGEHPGAQRSVPLVRPADQARDNERHGRDLTLSQDRNSRGQEIGIRIVEGHEHRTLGQELLSVESSQYRL